MDKTSNQKSLGLFKRLRIGTRLYLGIGVLLLFIVLMSAIINYQITVLKTQVDQAIEINVEQVKLATLAKQAFVVSYGNANKYLSSGDSSDRVQYEQAAKELNQHLEALEATVSDSDLLLVTTNDDGSRTITTRYNELMLQKIESEKETGVNKTEVFNIHTELNLAIEAHAEARAQVIESYDEYDESKNSANSFGGGYGDSYGGSSYGGYGDSFSGGYGGFGGSTYSAADSFLMSPMYFENSAQVGGAINNIMDWANAALKEAQVKVDTVQAGIRSIMIVLIVLGAFVSIIISFILGRSISRPITYIRDELLGIAEGGGDLSKRITVNSGDEAGELAEAFNLFVGSLQEMIRTIAQTANDVLEYSHELANNSTEAAESMGQVALTLDQLAEGSSKQSSSAADTVAAMNQLQGAIEQIARGTQEQAQAVSSTGDSAEKMSRMSDSVKESSMLLSEVAESTASAAENGRDAVKEVVSGMERINIATMDVAKKVDELGNYSGEIGKIIAVIDEIADQTSLLALNAAIEAARAGEHGKGFAVVADEVRSLSDRSRNATKEIGDLIKAIQMSIEVAVKSMSASTNEVNTGSVIAVRAQTSLDDILDAVARTNEEIHKVMSISQDMAVGSDEVASAIDRVAAVVEENTAASEEMAAGSEEVLEAVQNIAAISEESAASVEEVSASTDRVYSTMQAVKNAAQVLTDASEDLKQLVGKFTV